MKAIMSLLGAIGNKFWIPFVIFRIYSWFYKEVGFDLPVLEYWNIFALTIIIEIFRADISLFLNLANKPDKKDKFEYMQTGIFFSYAIILLVNYIIYITIF